MNPHQCKCRLSRRAILETSAVCQAASPEPGGYLPRSRPCPYKLIEFNVTFASPFQAIATFDACHSMCLRGL